MWRRHFLTGLSAGLAGAGMAVSKAVVAQASQGSGATLFVPGYDEGSAQIAGRPIVEDTRAGRAIPRGYDGAVTLLSRVDLESGLATRAVYPLQGHSITLAPSGDFGIFASIRGQRIIAFDTRTLDMIAVSEPFAPGAAGGDRFSGGGHCQFLPESGLLLVTERAPYRSFSGKMENHFGRMTLRDPKTLAVIESYSCHGIHPHDLRLLEGGRLVAVANYGSTRNQDRSSVVPKIIEPSITVIEVASGKLVEKFPVRPDGAETRHLAGAGNGNLFVIQVAKGQPGTEATWETGAAVEQDRLSRRGAVYMPAPLLKIARSDGVALPTAGGDVAALMRHGLSILHDPAQNQIIATFPGSHSVMAVDAVSGAITTVIRTDTLGLRYPCGLALHPDGQRYVVTGSFEDVYVFDRETHRLDREACRYLPLFRHSHVVMA